MRIASLVPSATGMCLPLGLDDEVGAVAASGGFEARRV
jgi:hypothetical protein